MTPSLPAPAADFWKRKLAAFLHDSPSKPLDIKSHELRADSALRRAGLLDDEGLKAFFDHGSDHTAAAADRLPFPCWESGIRCGYDPQANPFRHPLGAGSLARADTPLTAALAEDVEQNNQPGHLDTGHPADSAEDWRARFFAHWRLWRAHAVSAHAGFAALPADTRIPDHTIWTHMGVVSALEGCGGEPALLKFQLGPVQDFIAAARSTRDLWSGSMLLSWLMAAGLARLAESVGPDAVLFPNLWGQPLFDLRFRDAIWGKLKAGQNTSSVWSAEFAYPTRPVNRPLPLHTPNLPNVFLALVPAAQARELAGAVDSAIRAEWRLICDSVRAYADPLFGISDSTVAPDARERYAATTDRHLETAWQSFPFSGGTGQLMAAARQFLPDQTPVERVETLIRYFTQGIPKEHRDGRFYEGGKHGPKEKLNNLGVAWSLAVALTNWQLDATRALRPFAGQSGTGATGNAVGSHGGKDALDGRSPMLFGGSVDWLKAVHRLPAPAGGDWKKLFRHADEVGALTLVKRLWHLAYLKPSWGLEPHPMPNTYELAAGDTDQDDNTAAEYQSDDEGKYFAVLAFDGDSIGRWISGANTPAFGTQLAQGWSESPHAYFGRLDHTITPATDRLRPLLRPLSPSYHLQFSEALANFALHCAPRVVAAYGGKLVYAGGDDVLALLPAPRALDCADDLQRVFRGLSPQIACGLTELAPGFLSTDQDHLGRPIPLILPGPRVTASVGLAVAHFKQPLQDVVREAQAAEKRAKKILQSDLHKHALGVSLFKRSGETIHWDTRFDADHMADDDPAHRGGLLAAQWLLCALGCNLGSTPDRSRPPTDQVLSAKFPHRLAELLEAYVAEHGPADLPAKNLDVIVLFTRELDHALDRQRGPAWASPEGRDTRLRLRDTLINYVTQLPGDTATAKFKPVLHLLATAAFLARQPSLKTR